MRTTGGIARHSPDICVHDEREFHRRLLSLVESTTNAKWPGKVRLINFHAIKQRVGYAWPKLCEKIELLAAKIIRDELSLRDSYVRIGEAEFLLIFAEASPQEAKLRCLAIVEMIHEKIFGDDRHSKTSDNRIAECYVAHKADLPQKEEDSASPEGGANNRTPSDSLRDLFHSEAEVLDGGDVAESIQAVLDIIIRRASDSSSLAELGPLGQRLKHLEKSLTVLRPAIDAKESCAAKQRLVDQSLKEAENDTTELRAAIEHDSTRPHDVIMESLAKLRLTRAARAAKATPNRRRDFFKTSVNVSNTDEFEYVPVYRSVSQGEQLYGGIYRIGFRGQPSLNSIPPSDQSGDARHFDQLYQETAARERSLLEEAIRRCSDRTTWADFVLVAPVHVETLSRPYLQRRYTTMLRAVEARVKRRLIIDIAGYRESDDTIGMRRVIEELRGHAHAVFVSQSMSDIMNVKLVMEACRRLNAQAIGLDFSCSGESEVRISAALTQFAQMSLEHGIPTYISGIATTRALAKAIASGVSYICAPNLIPPEEKPSNFRRTTLKDLFWAIS